MKSFRLGPTNRSVSALSLGCMRMGGLPEPGDAVPVVEAALDAGIDFFDHADIYGGGSGEERFAYALRELGVARDAVYLQSKCGIVRGGGFDFSRGHILDSVDGSLRRLDTDYLDVLLLHRPDALMEPEEIADAFDTLAEAGKVRHFGVSNQNPAQMELLRRALDRPLVANQVQFGLGHTPLIDHGLNVNMADGHGIDRDGGTLEYCRLHDITPQAWSPLQHAFFPRPDPRASRIRGVERGTGPHRERTRGRTLRRGHRLDSAPPRPDPARAGKHDPLPNPRHGPRPRGGPHPPGMVRTLPRRRQPTSLSRKNI